MQIIEQENRYAAQTYRPLPVVLTRGQGVYLWDTENKRYLDMLSAYSAASHGHCHPRIIETLTQQACKLTITSRAFYTAQLAPFLEKICSLTQQDRALPMNTGAEAVETAIKAARRWAYQIKGVPDNKANIIVCENNFHGRTTSLISFSSEPAYKAHFGPLTPGFKTIPFGDAQALADAIDEHTAAFLVEPCQGEGGMHIPPKHYLSACADICKQHNMLLLCDEIQTGLGRTGKLLACEYDGVIPDGLILGKALGGGVLPISVFLSRKDVMDVFTPGSHGSTFGGNPLAAAVANTALDVLLDEKLIENSAQQGSYLLEQLKAIDSPLIKSVRGQGLFIGIEIDTTKIHAHTLCEKLMHKGLLCKESHGTVIRLTPPLIITREQIDDAVALLQTVF